MRAWIAILGGGDIPRHIWRERVIAQFGGIAVRRFACHDIASGRTDVVGGAIVMQIDYQARAATVEPFPEPWKRGASAPVCHTRTGAAAANPSMDGARWWPLLRPLSYVGWWREEGMGLMSSFRDDSISESAFSASLVGEFSFCGIRDNTLTLRADHYATQPCYYLPVAEGWLAVSDLRLAYGVFPEHFRVQESALRKLLSADRLVAENDASDGGTHFDAVWKVCPGETVLLRQGEPPRRQRVIDAAASMDKGRQTTLLDPSDATQAFAACFNQCVADRIAAGAGGVLLSGGLDSASVYAASHVVSPRTPMHGVCLSFRDPDLALSQDERIVAEMVQSLNGSCDILHTDEDLRIPMPEDTGMHLDGPDLCANVLSKAAVAQSFAQRGTDFVMTGEGGDLILGEVYYEWLGDALFRAEGAAGLDRYLTQGRGFRRGSPRYLLEFVSALSTRCTGWRAARAFAEAVSMPAPPYLRAAVDDMTSSYGIHGGQAERRWPAWLARDARGGDRLIGSPQCGAHRLLDAMLFPRAAYFDAIGTHLFHSHPFLDPRMIALARRLPAHCHFDTMLLRPHLGYACGKQLARNAYRNVLPASAANKHDKTSYALMARKLFANSVAAARAMMQDGMLLADRGLVDLPTFRRYFNAYAIVSADPNADLGMGFHYLRAVLDAEVWLRQVTAGQATALAGLVGPTDGDALHFRPFALAGVAGKRRAETAFTMDARLAPATAFVPRSAVIGSPCG